MGKSDLTWGYTKTSEHAHSSSLIPTHSYPPKIYLKPTLLNPPPPYPQKMSTQSNKLKIYLHLLPPTHKNIHPPTSTQNISTLTPNYPHTPIKNAHSPHPPKMYLHQSPPNPTNS